MQSPSPTKPLTERQKRNADKLLRGVDNMIVDLVRRIMPNATPDADLDDVAQDVRLHIATRVIPRWDAAKGTKFSTYAHLCITRFVLDQRRRWLRRRRDADGQLFDVIDPRNSAVDRKVESVAAAILKNPELLGLNATHNRILRTTFKAKPQAMLKDISNALGYRSTAFTSTALSNARKAIKKTDLQIVE